MTMKQSLFLDKSIQFAKACEKEFGKTETQYVRGTKQAGFVVLYQSSMPSCLVEIGFISNPAEEAFLNSNDGQTEIAQKLANAFKEFKFNYEDNSKKTINEPVAKKPTKLTANNAAQTPPEAISSITETPIEKIEPKKTVQEVAAPEKKPTLELSMEKIEQKKVEPEATVSSPNPTNTKIDPEKAVKKGKIDVDDTEDVYSYKPSKNSSINTENVVLYNKYSAIDTPTKPKEARTEVTQPKKTPLYIEDKKTNNATEAPHKTEVAKSDVMKYTKDVPTLYKETVIEKKQIETPTIEFSNTAPVKTITEIKKPEATEKPTPIEKPATNTKNELAYKIQVKASKGKINDINPSASLGKLEESYEDGLYKYLLGSFKTKEEAKAFLDRVKASGIADAFIVKYKNGVRVPLNVN